MYLSYISFFYTIFRTYPGVPAVFVSFVAFGVVSLLALVCNELLIEAKEAQGEKEIIWVNLLIFAGIYLVLMLSRVL